MTTKPTPDPKPGSSGEEFALLVEAVEDYAIFILSPDGKIRSWNRGAARIMGYEASEVLGRSFSRFYPAEDLRNRKPERELEVAAAEGKIEDEGWRIRADGARFWANTVITRLRDDTGALVGFAKVTRDMTARRAAEDAQRQSEELMRLLVHSVRDYAIFMLDPEGNVATWNEGARRIKGYEAQEIIGRHFSTFYPEEDVAAGKTERELAIARTQGSVEDEGWRLRKDGSRFWANVVITAVFDSSGELRGFAKVTRDITEKRQAEETRLAYLEQREARVRAEQERGRAEAEAVAAQESNRAKDEFLMMLSHELRTPMTAILGWARLLPSIAPGDPLYDEAIASIGRSAEVQTRLIDDVLDVSRIVAGKLNLALERVDISNLVKSAADDARTMAEGRSIQLSTSLPPDLGTFEADATRLHQVLLNLLTNAVKFTPRGGRITVSARRSGDEVAISVADSGQGIDPAFLPHVFEPFKQAESPRTRVHGGLGLGLSIVRHLVEAHDGRVEVHSEGVGKGSDFVVTLPIREHGLTTETDDPERNPEAVHPLRDLNVLLVEDDRETRTYISAVLRRAGARIVVCSSAAEALAAFDTSHPDLVLTDIAMPEMDGYALARALRERSDNRDLRIVALSAFAAPPTAAQDDDLDAYLAKPIDPDDLVAAIVRVAGRD